MGSLSLLQRIFPTQGSNPGLLHCREILYRLSHQGSPQHEGQEKLEASSHITLEEISFGVRYSKSYVKNKFKKETGKSIVQYFIGMKIEKAKKLLSFGDKTVNEVSDILGFSSVQYFCRQFKLHTDMTPTTYANSIKTDHLI